jgi:hypothetical protein
VSGSEWLEWRRLSLLAGAGVLLLAVLAISGVFTDGGGPAAASAGSAHSPTAHVASAAHSSSTARVRPSRYLGESYATAQRQLLQLGLVPRVSSGGASPTAKVTAISPIGRLKLGHTVTLTVLPSVVGPVSPPAHGKPKAPHAPDHKAKPVPPGHAKHDKPKWDHGPGGEHD